MTTAQTSPDDLASLEAGLDALEAPVESRPSPLRKAFSSTWPPVVAVALALVVPGVRRLRRSGPRAASGPGLVVAAAGAAAGVTAVSWAGQHVDRVGAVVAVLAVAVLVPALRRLLLEGRDGVARSLRARDRDIAAGATPS